MQYTTVLDRTPREEQQDDERAAKIDEKLAGLPYNKSQTWKYYVWSIDPKHGADLEDRFPASSGVKFAHSKFEVKVMLERRVTFFRWVELAPVLRLMVLGVFALNVAVFGARMVML